MKDFPEFDVIIADEIQDFSLREIQLLIDRSGFITYLFGDAEQKIYQKNLSGEVTCKIEDVIRTTNFNHIHLMKSFRISKPNLFFLKNVYEGKVVETDAAKFGSIDSSLKPEIVQCANSKDELVWIKNFLQDNNSLGSVGILLKRNNEFIGAYFKNQKLRKERVYGTKEIHHYLSKNGINCFYKYRNENHLNFERQDCVNIMTIHSAKGLQFDCVILPFSNYINENNGKLNLPYVALTRACNQIVITYSGSIADEYAINNINAGSFNGRIIKQESSDNFPDGVIYEQLMFEKAVLEQLPTNSDFPSLTKNIEDCEVFRF